MQPQRGSKVSCEQGLGHGGDEILQRHVFVQQDEVDDRVVDDIWGQSATGLCLLPTVTSRGWWAALTAHGPAGVDLLANQELLQLPDVHPGPRHGLWVPALGGAAILGRVTSWNNTKGSASVRVYAAVSLGVAFLPHGGFPRSLK